MKLSWIGKNKRIINHTAKSRVIAKHIQLNPHRNIGNGGFILIFTTNKCDENAQYEKLNVFQFRLIDVRLLDNKLLNIR